MATIMVVCMCLFLAVASTIREENKHSVQVIFIIYNLRGGDEEQNVADSVINIFSLNTHSVVNAFV